jgi:CHC2 zinc finger
LNVDELLQRLTKVKKAGQGKWVACCPAHEDRSPSLAIKEADGVILLHCFAGCTPDDICGAVGVEMKDLFPPTDKREWVGTEKPVKFGGGLKFSALDALRCLAGEASVVLLLACDMADGKVLGPEEQERLMTACGRLTSSLEYLGDNDIERPTIE